MTIIFYLYIKLLLLIISVIHTYIHIYYFNGILIHFPKIESLFLYSLNHNI